MSSEVLSCNGYLSVQYFFQEYNSVTYQNLHNWVFTLLHNLFWEPQNHFILPHYIVIDII